jgi:hypothetical protein
LPIASAPTARGWSKPSRLLDRALVNVISNLTERMDEPATA